MKIERLKREPEKVADKLGFIENQIKSVMGYEDSGDQLAKLEYSKARIEKELKQKQEDIDQLPKDDCNNFVLCLRLLINSLSYLMGISVKCLTILLTGETLWEKSNLGLLANPLFP